MSDSTTNSLKSAIQLEQIRSEQFRWRYAVLSAKVTAYIDGKGPAPTEDEFRQWREDGELAAKFQRLQVDAQATDGHSTLS